MAIEIERDAKARLVASTQRYFKEKLDGDPYRVRLWSGVEASPAEEIEFTQEEVDALKAIGYMGDE